MANAGNSSEIGGSSRFWTGLVGHIIRFRWLWLLGVLAVSLLFAMQISKVRFDNSSDIWFVEGHGILEAKARFDEAFGNYEFVYLLFNEERTPFTPENLRMMSALPEHFMETVPYAQKVTWLGNVERILGLGSEDQEVVIEDFLPEMPETQADLDTRLREALQETEFVDNLISRDGTVLTMLIELGAYPGEEEDSNPRYTVAEAVNAVLAESTFTALKPYVAGAPHFSYEYDALARQQTGKLFLMIVLVMAVLLLWLARGPRGIVVPLFVTSIAVFWTIGTIGAIGYTMNLLSIALPTMLICVGIGDSMHGIAAFHDHVDRGAARIDALKQAFGAVGGPIMLTSLTTAIGFLAYLTTHVKPFREMGVYVASGVVYAFVLTVILVPILYSFGKKQPERRTGRSHRDEAGDVFDRWLRLVHRTVVHHPRKIIVFFSALLALTFWGFTQMEIESNTSKLIFKSEPLRQTLDLVDERLGGAFSLEYLLDTGRESGVKDPVFMAKLDQLMLAAEEHPLVTKSVSVVTVLKKMHRALHGNDPDAYTLPESREALAQYLFLYETSGGDTLDRLVGFTYDQARLTLKLRSLDTADARALSDFMRAQIDALFPHAEVEITEAGGIRNYLALNDILFEGQRTSFVAALSAITLVMIVVLRSVRLGLISMVPNVLPVFATMGFMGLMGWYLDVITISFAAVIIGVAVDDTIHFFSRFKAEFNRSGVYEQALRDTLSSVGRPLTFTTIILVIGNAVFLASALLGFFKLGLLFGVAFTWALMADLFFSPALIMMLKPLGPERGGQGKEDGAIQDTLEPQASLR
jgi:hypothetical protein